MVQSLVNHAGSSIPDDDVRKFADSLSGGVFEPGSSGYEAARHVFNGMIDKRPGHSRSAAAPGRARRAPPLRRIVVLTRLVAL